MTITNTEDFYIDSRESSSVCAVLLSSALNIEAEKAEHFRIFARQLVENQGVREFRFTHNNSFSAYHDTLQRMVFPKPVRHIVYTHPHETPDPYPTFDGVVYISPKSHVIRSQYIQILQSLLYGAQYALLDSGDPLAADNLLYQQLKKFPHLKILDISQPVSL